MRSLAIVKTGSTMPALAQRRGDFEDWILEGLGWRRSDAVVVDVVAGERLPGPDSIAGIVVSGSHAMVTDRHGWSEATGRWLRRAAGAGVPLLGICYGHQLLADALGGRVGPSPSGGEVGTVRVTLTSEGTADPLLGGLGTTILVHASHEQSVLALPPGARVLGRSDLEPHQAVAFGPRAWGVQFHPEFDEEVMGEYIRRHVAGRAMARTDGDALLATCVETPSGPVILGRFAEIVAAGR